jgi:ABC-2 type transport system ATP-binding protein
VEPILDLADIRKDYGSVRALDGVALRINAGITGLLGPNGAGKTTLIKAVLGLVSIGSGSGTVLGHRLGAESRAIRAKIGYMPEDDCYLTGLSGVEMLQFAACLSGLPRIEALRRAHEILDFCGVEQERYRAVETYSTGMRQKLKFAQAIVHDPPLLILDEPTAGLDPEEREAMLSRVRVLASRAGKSVLLSTHILPDVQTTCQFVVIMSRGQVRVAEHLVALNRPSSPTLQVQVFGDPGRLVEAMRGRGLDVREQSGDTLTLAYVQDDVYSMIWQCARTCGVGLRSIAPARNSLEQIFLEAVAEESDAHS